MKNQALGALALLTALLVSFNFRESPTRASVDSPPLGYSANPDLLMENILKFSSDADVFACSEPYQDINGLVVIEAENLTTPSGWLRGTSYTGFTGSGYINWTGNEYFSTVGIGLVSTKIFINSPGVYRFQMRTRVGNGNSNTENNDTWVRFPDASDFYGQKSGSSVKIYPKGSGKTPTPEGAGLGGWFKVYMNSLNWTWNTFTSDNDPHDIYVQFNSSGVYTMELSARSAFHLIDRIVMHKNASNPLSLTNQETKCTDSSPTVPVSGIAVSPTSASVSVGGATQLTASVSPTNATNKSVVWSTSNSNVATVNSNGLVTAIAVGTATITARTQDGNFTATSSINVTQNTSTQSIANFVLINAANDTEIQTLTNGSQLLASQVGNLSLNFKVNTNPTTVGSVQISISGPLNSTVTESVAPYALFGDVNGNYNGIILPIGNYTLSATPFSSSNRGGTVGQTTTIQFSIVQSTSIPVSGVAVTPGSASILVGGTQQITATVAPSNASNKSVVWSSSNNDVASVNSNGLVTGLSVGNATITARTEDGNFTATSNITVNPTIPTLSVTSFVLVNAANDSDIQTLVNGTQLLSSQVGNFSLNIKVNSNPTIAGSVFISLSGPINTSRTENGAPYALFGDNNGDFLGRTLPSGNYTLSATVYSGANRTGTAGPQASISFQIVSANTRSVNDQIGNGTSELSTTEISTKKSTAPIEHQVDFDYQSESLKVYPNPVKGDKLYISDPTWGEGTVSYSIYNGSGKMIESGSGKIDVSKKIELNIEKTKFPTGIYYLVLQGDYLFRPRVVSILIE